MSNEQPHTTYTCAIHYVRWMNNYHRPLGWLMGRTKSSRLLTWRCLSQRGSRNSLQPPFGIHMTRGTLSHGTIHPSYTTTPKDPDTQIFRPDRSHAAPSASPHTPRIIRGRLQGSKLVRLFRQSCIHAYTPYLTSTSARRQNALPGLSASSQERYSPPVIPPNQIKSNQISKKAKSTDDSNPNRRKYLKRAINTRQATIDNLVSAPKGLGSLHADARDGGFLV